MRRTWKMGLALVMAASVGISSISMPTHAATTQTISEKEEREFRFKKELPSYKEGEALVMYDSEDALTTQKSIAKVGNDIEIVRSYAFGGDKTKIQSNDATGKGVTVALVKSDTKSTKELIQTLKKRKGVRYAEPNFRIKARTTGTDTYKELQWGLDNQGQQAGTAGYDVNADAISYENSDGEEKVIALVDTGIDYNHEDLKDVVWKNEFESKKLKGAHGYDFINYDDDPLDDNGHGSHCSGIMAATQGNNAGISGVATSENVKIMALKILDEEGYGYGMEAVGAYNYIYKAQQLGVNVVAVNNSWGGGSDDSNILEELINLVGENGAISVCAAGNSAEDNDVVESLPCNIDSPYVISVAASNEKDELTTFSCYGANNVDIAAPGANILSTVSYDCFNPTLYDAQKKDDLCHVEQDFSQGNPVEIFRDGEFNNAEVETGDIAYGIDTHEGEASHSLNLTDKEFFGAKKEGEKSLEWKVTGASKGDVYHLYFPYTVEGEEEGKKRTKYDSVMAKINGPMTEEGTDPDDFFADFSVMYVCDGEIKEDGGYDQEKESYISGTYVDYNNYWDHFSGKTKVKVGQKRALCIQLLAAADGDYTVYLDNLGITKNDVDSSEFGKYDFYNGTSMATPHVTGAVAALADAYPEDSAEERVARILGSTRKSKSLEGKVSTGGVLNLDKAANPNMSIIGTSLGEDDTIEVYGSYLDGASVTINGDEVEVLEQETDYVLLDATEYLDRYVTIQLKKEDNSISVKRYISNAKNFEEGIGTSGYLNGGSVTTDGNAMYYVDDEGVVSVGTPMTEDDMKTLEWEELGDGYTMDVFGEEYEYCMEGEFTAMTDVAYAGGMLWNVVKLDVGYSESTILACYDPEDGYWFKMADLPEELEEVQGYTLAAHGGSLYLMGGYDTANGGFTEDVYAYSVDKEEWESKGKLPEGRAYAKAISVADQLVVTLGGCEEGVAKTNLIYDGKQWSKSATDMGDVCESREIVLKSTPEVTSSIEVVEAQIGAVDGGIVYTDCIVDGLGDTFIYNLEEDAFEKAGYQLDKSSLFCDQLFATTVQEDLYVIYGVSDEWFWEDWLAAKRNVTEDDDEYDEDEEDYEDYEDYEDGSSLGILTMPVSTPYIKVAHQCQEGAEIIGAAYGMPGEMISFAVEAFDGYVVTGVKVNGTVMDGEDGIYFYEIPKDLTTKRIAIVVTTQEKDSSAFPPFAIPTTPPTILTPDAVPTSPTATVAPTNAPGAVPSAAPSHVPTTPKEENKVVVGSKVKVGKATYKVLSNSSKKRTVSFVSFDKKNAKKVTVPASVKIDGKKYQVTQIEAKAIKMCKKLKKLTIKSAKLTKIGKNNMSKKLTVKVPKKVKKSYKKMLKKAGIKATIK